jgi:endoribonuclease Dicer
MKSVYCKNCSRSLGASNFFAFYQQTANSCHFMAKPEFRNNFLLMLRFKQPSDIKRRKFTPNNLFCIGCDKKLGTESNIGPNGQSALCFKIDAIFFLDSMHGTRLQFAENDKWSLTYPKVGAEFEMRRGADYFYGAKHKLDKIENDRKNNRLPTRFAHIDELVDMDVASMVIDSPRTYQVEMFVAGMLANSVIYLPTGTGKTLVAAMILAVMKKLNPKKKIFFVTDRIPLVFQQASYIRYQCHLTVGEFCGENKQFASSQLEYDVLVFTCEFLNNMLFNKNLYMEDCSCLIIDEIHHACNKEHSFARLVANYYASIDKAEYKPRLIGLTASPSGSSLNEAEIKARLEILTSLIGGDVVMPLEYKLDLKIAENRPLIRFIEANTTMSHMHQLRLIGMIGELIKPFLFKLRNIELRLDTQHGLNTLRSFVDNLLKESTSTDLDYKRFNIAKFLQNILASLETLSIVGTTLAIEQIQSCIFDEKQKDRKNKLWSNYELDLMNKFNQDVQSLAFVQDSGKLMVLIDLLKAETDVSNRNSKLIIFVRTRRTARLLTDMLRKDENLRGQLNPKLFVGHANGSIEGMSWFDEQQPTLISFRNDECRLLISTNVLQEGIINIHSTFLSYLVYLNQII